MKTLGNLKPAKGSNRKKKRLGRGPGSGLGKTAGKGHKGQKARKGGKVAPGFEGGQTPLYRRLPKRGFTNLFRKDFFGLNLDSLSKAAGSEWDPDSLVKAGLVPKGRKVKILGRGEITSALKISTHKISKSAQAAIEKAGGSVTIVKGEERSKPVRNKMGSQKKN